MNDEFEEAGAVVYGISRDSVRSHKKFADKLGGLPFALLSDKDKTVHEAFALMRPKTMMGKIVTGMDRSTFVFSSDGELAKKYSPVKVPGHAEEVLEFVNGLE